MSNSDTRQRVRTDYGEGYLLTPSAGDSFAKVQLVNRGQVITMPYTYGDMSIVDNPNDTMMYNPNTNRVESVLTGFTISKSFVDKYYSSRRNPLSIDSIGTATNELGKIYTYWNNQVLDIRVRDRNGDIITDFPESPDDFNPEGYERQERAGGDIIHWKKPGEKHPEYAHHKDERYGDHYHKGRDKKETHEKHPDTGDAHMRPGERIPEAEGE